MYHLTLTAGERKAIDFVGNRYGHGCDLYRLLWVESEQTPIDADWDDPRDITFAVPENIAWEIYQIGEESCFLWDLFADDLAAKMTDFCQRIV